MQQIPMRVMDFNDVEPCLKGPLHRRHKSSLELLNVLFCHRSRLWIPVTEGQRTRRFHSIRPPPNSLYGCVSHTQPRRNRTRLAPCMSELDPNLLPLAMRKLYDSPEWSDLAVFPQTGVFGRDAAFGEYGGCFDKSETGATRDNAAPVREAAVGEVGVVSRVLAERREGDAALAGYGAEGDGSEEV